MGPTCLDTECRLRGPAGWRDQTGLVRTGYRKELRTLGCQKGGDGLAPAPKGRVYVTGGPGSQDRDSRVERGTAGVYQGASCPSAPPPLARGPEWEPAGLGLHPLIVPLPSALRLGRGRAPRRGPASECGKFLSRALNPAPSQTPRGAGARAPAVSLCILTSRPRAPSHPGTLGLSLPSRTQNPSGKTGGGGEEQWQGKGVPQAEPRLLWFFLPPRLSPHPFPVTQPSTPHCG